MSKFEEAYYKIIAEATGQEAAYQNMTLAIVPGSFKPPHKGHWEMVMKYAEISDKVLVLISNISIAANSSRPLSKSNILAFSKILNKYKVDDSRILAVIRDIQEHPESLTYDTVSKHISDICDYLVSDSDMSIDLKKFEVRLRESTLKSIRWTADDREITPEMSKQIFDIFAKASNVSNKIEIQVANNASPMSAAVPIINEQCKQCKIILGSSNKGDDASRWPSFMPSFEPGNENEFIDQPVKVDTMMSSSDIRANINDIQRNWFPDNLSDDDFEHIKRILEER